MGKIGQKCGSKCVREMGIVAGFVMEMDGLKCIT